MNIEPKQKEIWMVDLGEFVPNSSIQRGKKPCIIISNVKETEWDEEPCRVITVGPLTRKIKSMYIPTHTLITKEEGVRDDSCFLGEQTTTVLVERCIRKLSEINDDTFMRVAQCLIVCYDLQGLFPNLPEMWNSSHRKGDTP